MCRQTTSYESPDGFRFEIELEYLNQTRVILLVEDCASGKQRKFRYGPGHTDGWIKDGEIDLEKFVEDVASTDIVAYNWGEGK